MYVFGGMSKGETFDELWKFDLTLTTWEKINTKGSCPPARVAHSFTFMNSSHCGILFGGMSRSPKLTTFDDVYLYDVLNASWTLLDAIAMPPGPPEARLDHDACIIPLYKRDAEGSVLEKTRGESLVIFGGMSMTTVFNDVFVLTL
jgi:hypothetical protein